MMNAPSFNPAINPVIQCIQTNGMPGFMSQVQAGGINASLAFNAVGTAIDRYVGESPPNDCPTELRYAIKALPGGDVASDIQGDILSLMDTHQAVVKKAVRIYAINAKAPFDLGKQLRWIPPGRFRMGSANDDPHAYDDEKPLRSVMMTGGFYMLDHPVTNAELWAFIKATGYEDMRDLKLKFEGARQPVVKASHERAIEFSRWFGEQVRENKGVPVSGRLPTEAEWEKAAKGPDGNEFIIPATIKQAHFNAVTTRAVDHPYAYANGYGLKDVIGNVWECTSSPREEGSFEFVLRGASWQVHLRSPRHLRAAYRSDFHTGSPDVTVGFRPVLVPQGSQG